MSGQAIPDINMPIISINVVYQHSYPQVYPQLNLTKWGNMVL